MTEHAGLVVLVLAGASEAAVTHVHVPSPSARSDLMIVVDRGRHLQPIDHDHEMPDFGLPLIQVSADPQTVSVSELAAAG